MGETPESDVRRGPAGLSAEPARGVLMRLNALRNILPTAAQQVADYILRNPAEVVRQSVTEVAEAAAVSEGTVVRVCQQLGVKGFQDLKLSLAYELIEPVEFIYVWGEYLITLTMLDFPELETVSIAVTKLQGWGAHFTSSILAGYGAEAAAYVIAMAPVVLMFILLQKWFVRGLSERILKL